LYRGANYALLFTALINVCVGAIFSPQSFEAADFDVIDATLPAAGDMQSWWCESASSHWKAILECVAADIGAIKCITIDHRRYDDIVSAAGAMSQCTEKCKITFEDESPICLRTGEYLAQLRSIAILWSAVGGLRARPLSGTSILAAETMAIFIKDINRESEVIQTMCSALLNAFKELYADDDIRNGLIHPAQLALVPTSLIN
jgi:hypothetical protein